MTGSRQAAFLVLVASLLVASPAAEGAVDETELISIQSGDAGGLGADGVSFDPVLSADGRYVAFESNAANLSSEDNDAVRDVFLRDTQTGTITLVSRRSAAEGGAGGNDVSEVSAISADGRYVAFSSDADNLSASDVNAHVNVFVRDTQTATTILVSRQSAADGGDGGDGQSAFASMSADGRYVAFGSSATNLAADDDNGETDIFVRDLQTNATTLVSRRSALSGNGPANDSSFNADISADGRYVAFESSADNLSSIDDNAVFNVFVRDLQTGSVRLVSRRSAGGPDGGDGGNGHSRRPSLSADGRYVAFDSEADNLSDEDDNAVINVLVRDLELDTTTLGSRQSGAGAGADGESRDAALSPDARLLAFESDADNLSTADNGNARDVFVRDLQTGAVALASRRSASDGGTGGDDDSGGAAFSGDGRYLGFHSGANNLSALDSDGVFDVFRRDLFGPGGVTGDPGGPPGADTTRPKLSKLSLSRRQVARGHATRLRFELSEAADVRIEVRRRKAGHYRKIGVVRKRNRDAGRNSIRIAGRLRGKALKQGRFQFVLTAADDAGNRSVPKKLRFRIV
jgi:Tol biopolymer transport system component